MIKCFHVSVKSKELDCHLNSAYQKVNNINTFIFFRTSFLRWQVCLGRQNLQGENPNEVFRSVAEIIKHPDYDSRTYNNDIALLRLSSPVKFTDYIRPVCLAATGSVFNSGTESWITGWGAVREGGELCLHSVFRWSECSVFLPDFSPLPIVLLPFPQTLQEVVVPVVGNKQCSCLNGVGKITINMICAGLSAGGKDSCQVGCFILFITSSMLKTFRNICSFILGRFRRSNGE